MKVKNLNSSSRKTKNKIKEAFAELVKEKKELSNVTVTELVKKADITRSTFYTHYDNIYDVAQEFQDEAIKLFMTNTENIKTIEGINNYFDEIIIHLKENEKIYSMLLSSDFPLIFSNKLGKLINTKLYDFLKFKKIDNLDLIISFFSSGCINLVIKYYRKEIDASLEEIGNFIKNACISLFIEK